MKKVLPTLVILVLIGVLGVVFYNNYFVKYTYTGQLVRLSCQEDRGAVLS